MGTTCCYLSLKQITSGQGKFQGTRTTRVRGGSTAHNGWVCYHYTTYLTGHTWVCCVPASLCGNSLENRRLFRFTNFYFHISRKYLENGIEKWCWINWSMVLWKYCTRLLENNKKWHYLLKSILPKGKIEKWNKNVGQICLQCNSLSFPTFILDFQYPG